MFHPRPALLRFGLLACLLSGGVMASVPTRSDASSTLTLNVGNTYASAATVSANTALAGSRANLTMASAGQVTTAAAIPAYSQFIVFGDSLSDTGNFAATTEDEFGIRYPSNDFNYANGRFTNDSDTSPPAQQYSGVWHEQLARLFLGLKPATASLDGGTDYAFGDAETLEGQRDVQIDGLDIHIDNLNRQLANYLGNNTPDPLALYIVWAGSNDLFEDDSATNVTGAAQRVTAAVQRLAEAGAKTFLVPNLPPLGLTPSYSSGNAATAAAITQAASDFRDQLNADLDTLQTTLDAEGLTVTIHRLDIFGLFNRLTASGGAAAYGFANITDSAQGESIKADQYLFWDDVHPTTYGHFQIAAEAFAVLSGTPVVEISRLDNHINRATGETGTFLFTRTGPDVSQALQVFYGVSGSATANGQFPMLKGFKKIKPGQRTAKVNFVPSAEPAGSGTSKVKLRLEAGDGYALPVNPKSIINLDTTNE